MDTLLKRGLRYIPGLQDGVRQARQRLHTSRLHRVEAQVSQSAGYEILVVFGMRRSGNHLAINWILEQVDGAAVFYNNIKPDRPPYSGRMTEYRRRRGPSPRIVLSYEDVDPDQLLSPPLLSFLDDRVARHGAKVRFALILRDPYNLFASRLRKWPERFATPADISDQIALYKQLAPLADAPSSLWRDAPLVPILYNDLVVDPAARDRVAGALGIRNGNRGLDAVPVYGHGSSFDGTTVSGDGVRDNVFDRWRALENDPVFQGIASDPGLRDIGRRLFALDGPDGVRPDGLRPDGAAPA